MEDLVIWIEQTDELEETKAERNHKRRLTTQKQTEGGMAEEKYAQSLYGQGLWQWEDTDSQVITEGKTDSIKSKVAKMVLETVL